MLARQVVVTGLPSASVVARLARLRPIASSLIAGAPPHRSMSQLDCQPPRLECCVLGWLCSRSAMIRRKSAFRVAPFATSKVMTGVANSGVISGAVLMLGDYVSAFELQRRASHRVNGP